MLAFRCRALLPSIAVLVALAGLGFPARAAGIKYTFFCDGADAKTVAERTLGATEPAGQIALDLSTAEVAIAKVASLRRGLMAGEPIEAPYDGAARFAGMARTTKDPVDAELFRRAALDLFWRSHLTAAASRASWAAELSDGALQIAFTTVTDTDMCGVDADNARWLRQQIEAHGWFKRSTHGDAADTAAFAIVQHADQDRPFQKEVLQLIEPLVATQDTRPASYALLSDRVAVAEGRPQKYGSQGRCVGPGKWTENTVESPESIDEIRAQVGLEPIMAYRQRFTCN